MCANHLLVRDEDPVVLTGSLDTSLNLQMLHTHGSLASYSQCIHAAHDDLNEPTGIITVKLIDFDDGSNTWELSASHNGGAVTWSRSSGFAYFDFGPLESEVEVDILATSNASPPQTKIRKIWVKTKPTDGLPDNPLMLSAKSHSG